MATIIEQKTEDRNKVRTQIDDKVREYNAKKAIETTTAKELQAIMDDIEKLSKEHAGLSKSLAYAKFKEDPEGPMIAACRAGGYPAIKVVDEKIDDSSETRLKVEDTDRKVDLGDLHKALDGIGSDKKWIYALEKLNLMMTADRAKELGASTRRLQEINDSFRMSQLAKDYDLGKNPCSNTKLIDTIKGITIQMLGEELGKKAIKADMMYLKYVFSRADSKNLLKVKCATNKQMRVYMLAICHRIVTGGAYDVDFQVKKQK